MGFAATTTAAEATSTVESFLELGHTVAHTTTPRDVARRAQKTF